MRRNDYAGSAVGHDFAELLEHERGAVEIHMQDRIRRRLTGGGTGGVDEPCDFPDSRRVVESASTASREDTSTVATLTW